MGAHAKARFTLRGKLTKTKYQEMSENYKDKVKVKNHELKETLKQEKMSQRAASRIQNGGMLDKLRKQERDAVATLTKADAMARIATRHALKSKEKAATLVNAKNAKTKAETAVLAKKAAEEHLAARK